VLQPSLAPAPGLAARLFGALQDFARSLEFNPLKAVPVFVRFFFKTYSSPFSSSP